MGKAFVIGAGLAGLAAAVRLAERGVAVEVFEGAGRAGGRCRSFYDKALDRVIDNGNHLLMSGNRRALAFLETLGASDRLIGPPHAAYPFVDVRTGQRWAISLGDGPVPLWALDPDRRVPDTRLADYLGAVKLLFAGPQATVSDVIRSEGALYERFWEPLVWAALNTTPAKGQARLMAAVLRETFLKGGAYARPLIAKEGLGPAFVDPAAAYLAQKGAVLRTNTVLRSARFEAGRVAGLQFGNGEVEVGTDDAVVFALPPQKLRKVLPEADPPSDESAILNVHYRLAKPAPAQALGGAPFIGMLGANAHWAFVRGDVVSLTISAADVLGIDQIPHEELSTNLWQETQTALGISGTPYEAVRIITEKRATFDQSPAGVAKRLKPETRFANLFLAGDHVDTGLPATIEGAIRSGEQAATLVARLFGAAR